MKRLPWMLAAGLILAGTSARAADSSLPEPQLITLENGLRLLLAPDPGVSAVDVAVWYDSGPRYERPGKTGIAHLFEHLMFRGSSHVGADEHSRRVRAEGGTSGAYAAADYTCFYETLPADALELAFQLEADRMTGLRLTAEGIDAERGQVQSERDRRPAPTGPGLDRLYAMAFEAHPYRWPVYGLPEDLGRLTLQDFRDFYHAHFGPDHAVVTVTGHFGSEEAIALARKHFGPLRPGGVKSPAPAAPGPQAAERRGTLPGVSPVPTFMVGWPAPPRSDPDWPALSLLSTVLAGGTSARLPRVLIVERPLCLSIRGSLDTRRDASLFTIAASVAPDQDTTEVETRMLHEVERLAAEPVTAEELEGAKRRTETTVWLGLQTSHGRAQVLGQSLLLGGDARQFARLIERLRACTVEDLQRAARRLDARRRNVLWLMPSEEAAPAGAHGGRP